MVKCCRGDASRLDEFEHVDAFENLEALEHLKQAR